MNTSKKTRIPSKNTVFWSLVLLAALAGTALLLRSPTPQQALQSAKKTVLTVQTQTPILKDIQLPLSLSGPLTPWQESSIQAQLPALPITNVYVDVADVVKKGQLLATLDAQSIAIEKSQLQAQLSEATSALEIATQNAQRAKALEESPALSAVQREQMLHAQKSAQAKVQALHAQLKATEIKGSYTRITAPAAGVISERKATIGSLSSGVELFRLIVDGTLLWQPSIPTASLPLLKKGMQLQIPLAHNQFITLPLQSIAPKVNPQTRQATLQVKISPKEHQDLLKPGMFVTGSLLLPKTQKMLIPKDALLLVDGIHTVFVVQNGLAIQKSVTRGALIDNHILIEEGLAPTDQVITLGAAFLKNNDPVLVQGSGS